MRVFVFYRQKPALAREISGRWEVVWPPTAETRKQRGTTKPMGDPFKELTLTRGVREIRQRLEAL